GLIPGDKPSDQDKAAEAFAGALTLAAAIYGPSNPHTDTLRRAEDDARRTWGMTFQTDDLKAAVRGVLNALRADIELGVVGSIEQRGYGLAMADLVEGARAALAYGAGPGETQVAAVLAAAAYEDTMRRMGTALAEMTEDPRPTLETIIQQLKAKDVLRG